jgi:hypothetical protein
MPWGSSSERLRKFVSYRRTDPENVSTVIERHRRPTTCRAQKCDLALSPNHIRCETLPLMI